MKRGDLFPRHGSLHPSIKFPAVLVGPFADFWAAYPVRRPNPRAQAADAFARILRRGDLQPEQLVAAAKAFAIEVKERRIAEEFVPHTRTWLSQGRYLDYLPQADAEAPPASAVPEHPLWPRLSGHIDAPTFNAWIGRCQLVELTGELLILRAPSSFVAGRMREEFLPLLRRVLSGDGTFQIVLQLPEA